MTEKNAPFAYSSRFLHLTQAIGRQEDTENNSIADFLDEFANCAELDIQNLIDYCIPISSIFGDGGLTHKITTAVNKEALLNFEWVTRHEG